MKKFKDLRSFFKNTNTRPEETTDDVETINRKKTNITIQPDASPTTSSADVICSGEEIGTNFTKRQHLDLTTKPYSSPTTTAAGAVVTGEQVGISVTERKTNLNLGTLETGPLQPGINFPRSKFGDRQRSFSANYYDTYSWLEYSVIEDKSYCFVCRQFSKGIIREQSEKFIHHGFNNWKKMKEGLQKHEQSSLHIQCTEMFVSYKQSVVHGSVKK